MKLLRLFLLLLIINNILFSKTNNTKPKDYLYQYENLINSSLIAMKQNFTLNIEKIKETANEAQATLTAKNKNIAITVTSDNKGIKLLTFAGGGDGTPNSAVELSVAAVSAILALDDPFVTKKERGKVFHLINFPKIIKTNEPNQFKYKNYNLTSSFSPQTGLIIIAQRAKQ